MSFLGTCVNSFDEDGYCEVSGIPYSDTTEFAQAEEQAVKISQQEFINKAGEIPNDLKMELSDNLVFLHDQDNNLFMVYDGDSDIHYFFSHDPVDEEYLKELAQWKRIAGITETTETTTVAQQQYKIGTPEWFNRPVDTSRFPAGFRGRVKK
jgi:hypothetical protein